MIKMDMQENVRKNILQELRILHNAKCEHIVQCFGSFYDGGIIYSVLEFMDGGSLAHILKTHKKLGERYLAKIAKHVLVGMIYLHKELHIIHRDVKPSNLLVNQAGQVRPLLARTGHTRSLPHPPTCLARCHAYAHPPSRGGAPPTAPWPTSRVPPPPP